MKRLGSYYFLILTASLSFGQTFEFRTYYDKEKSQLKEIISLSQIDSTLQGPYSSFMQDGAPKAAGYYEQGKASGTWTYYYEDNRVRAKGGLENGKQNGLWSYYFESGHLKTEGFMRQGVREGEWVNYYENGDQKSRGIYLNNKKDGLWKYYFEGGDLKSETEFSDGIGIYREFFLNGQIKLEGQIRNDKSEGLWKYYYQSGKIESEGNFKNGLRVGKWNFYHENGELSSEGMYESGKRTGEWIYYYKTGSISSRGTLVDDTREGRWNLFFENGEVRSSTEYLHGNGPSKEYYPSGQVLAQGNIQNGKKDGLWEYFDESGFKNGEATFTNGIGDFKGFYNNGNISMAGKLENSRQVGEWILYNEDGEISGKYKPMYQEDVAVNSAESYRQNIISRKPDYRYKSHHNRYFDVVTNEFKGVGFTTNPIWTAAGFLPVAIEYYVQERLAYEIMYTYYRDPFFTPQNEIQLGDRYSTGHGVRIRQKFLSRDKDIGMPYFGHNIGLMYNTHTVDIITDPSRLIAEETVAFYGVFVGVKWLRSTKQRGITVDLFVGMDIGLRNWDRQYPVDDSFDDYFKDLEQNDLYLPFTFGINFGWMSSVQRIKKVLNGK